MVPKKIILSWSGGKDSALALYELSRSGEYEVAGLLTTVTEEYDRISIHGVRRALLLRQAEALGMPLTVVTIPPQCENGVYEARMGAAMESCRAAGIRKIAFGDIFLADVRRYREDNLAQANMEAVFPLWGRDTDGLARDFIRLGFRAVLTCVDTRALPSALAGREFDASLLAGLPDGVDPGGENGEYHTFVYAGPVFRRQVDFIKGERVLRDNRFAFCDLVYPEVSGIP